MLKYVTVVLAMVVLGEAQRSPYAGTPNRYPQVLPRFKEDQTTQSIPTTSPTVIGNRNEFDDSNAIPSAGEATPATTSTTTTSTTPLNLPVDALGDVDLVNRIKTWPREKQPFWFINWQQIEQHRSDQAPRIQPTVNSRSFFAG